MPSSTRLAARRPLADAALVAVLAAASLLPAVAAAQAPTVTVVGRVVDVSATPIPAAEVYVPDTRLSARADDKGFFALAGLPEGEFAVGFRRLGFKPRVERYAVRGGDTLKLIVELVATPTALSEVTVTGKRTERRMTWLDQFERRRAQGFGSFVTRDEIDRRNPTRTTDILRTVTGVTVLPVNGRSSVRMARSPTCAPDVYIDGQQARGFEVDDMPPADIAGIEVFHGPAETPVSFRHFMAGCGVVSIWTQPPGSK